MKQRYRHTLHLLLTISIFALFIAACQRRASYHTQLVLVDSLADTRPMQADSLLRTLASAMPLASTADSMFYSLMRLKTDDKLYHDITDRRALAFRLVDYYEHERSTLLPTALFYAGRVCADLGDAPQALDFYQKALQTLNGGDDAKMQGAIHGQIGYIFYYQGLFSQALEHFKESYRFGKAINDTIGSIYNLRDVANSYLQLQELDSCENNLQSALSLVDAINNKELHADILSQLARLYNKKQMYSQARDVVMPLLENCTDSNNLSAYYSIAAIAYSQLGNIDSTRILCLKLMDVGNKYGQQFASKTLADFAFSSHNVKDALHYTKLYERLTDSIHKADNAKAVMQIHSMYNYQLYQNENARLRIAYERKQKTVYIVLAAFFVLTMFMVVVVLYNRYKQAKFQIWVERLQNQNQQNERAIQNYKMQILEDIDSIKQLDESKKQLMDELHSLQQDNEINYEYNKSLKQQYMLQIQNIDNEKMLLKKQLEGIKSDLSYLEKLKREEMEKLVHSEEVVRNSDVYNLLQEKTHNHGKSSAVMMSQSDWAEVENVVNHAYLNIMPRLSAHVSLNETERRVTLLILMGLPHKSIAELVCVSLSAESAARRRLYEKVAKKKGTAQDWDNFVRDYGKLRADLTP